MTDEQPPHNESPLVFSARLREVIGLALPAICTSLVQTLIFVADRVMLGRHSAAALAAMQNAGPCEWAVFSVFVAFETATLARSGAAFGRGDRVAFQRCSLASYLIALVSGLVLVLSSPSLRWVAGRLFASPPSIAWPLADAYLSITLVASPLAFISVVGLMTLIAAGDTRTSLAIAALGASLHLLQNRLLIFGGWGIPALGMRGCGLSTALTFAVEALVTTLVVNSRYGLFAAIRGIPLRGELSALANLSWPSILERIAYHVGFLGFAGLVASLGESAMAANQALATIESIPVLTADGFGVAAASLAARRFSERPRDAAASTAVCALLAAFTLTFMGLISLALGPVVLPAVSTDRAVLALSISVLPILAIAQPFMGVALVCSAALRGAGGARAALITSLVGAFFVRLSVTYLLLRCFHSGLRGVWLGSTLDWAVRTIVLFWIWNQMRLSKPTISSRTESPG